MLHFEIDVTLFSPSEARRNFFGKDPQAQYALSLFPEAERLLTLAHGRPAGPSAGSAGK
jgi:hypothetical protein